MNKIKNIQPSLLPIADTPREMTDTHTTDTTTVMFEIELLMKHIAKPHITN